MYADWRTNGRLYVLVSGGNRVQTKSSGVLLLLLLLTSTSSPLVLPNTTTSSWHTLARAANDVIISEVLVSASSLDYNGTDWNGDGVVGSESDQFIELWNRGTQPVDVSNWILDDITDGGSGPCRLAWNTTIEANGYIVIFRSSSRIELDYWDAETVTISDASGIVIDTLSYPAEDSWWDTSYVKNTEGVITKIAPPTPGWGEGETYATAQHMVRCYGMTDNVHSGAYVLKGRLVLMTGEEDVINEGHILVKDGMIEAIWESTPPPTINLTGVHVIDTHATIYPGLLDLHNHLHYNQAPLWEMTPHLPADQRNAWGGYNNRYEWKNHPDYSEQVTRVEDLIHGAPYWNLDDEAMKYIEMKSIIGGTTSAQGSPTNPDDSYATILARNIEDYNFGRDEIHTKVTELTSDYIGNHIKTGNASGELDAWFVHIAEGVDQRSRAEFDILVNNDLLVGELVLIHGVALTKAEYDKMAQVGATLVWSPLSNLLLYGQTADVAAAKEAGVRITLAPDWAPSGSKSPLHELKVADLWDDEILGDIFTDYELVEMVTSSAARATNWHHEVGTLQEGMVADLVIVDNIHPNPYRNLVNAVDPDIRLTIVGGLALFGDEDIMAELKGSDYEAAGAFGKVLDITFLSAPEGAQSWASITENLTIAMQFNIEDMTAAFGDATDFQNKVAGMGPVGLDPWYTYGDERYFRVLNGSSTANAQVDMSLLYERYYQREENVPEVTDFEIVVIDEVLCTDGTSPPCQDDTTPVGDGELDNNSGVTDDQDILDDQQTDTQLDTSASDDESMKNKALLLFFSLVVVMMLALFLLSKSSAPLNNDEVQIEKMWVEEFTEDEAMVREQITKADEMLVEQGRTTDEMLVEQGRTTDEMLVEQARSTDEMLVEQGRTTDDMLASAVTKTEQTPPRFIPAPPPKGPPKQSE